MKLFQPEPDTFELLKVEVVGPWKTLGSECVKVEVYFTANRGGVVESPSYIAQYLPGGVDSLYDLKGRAFVRTDFAVWTPATEAVVGELEKLCEDEDYNPTHSDRAAYLGKLLGSLYCLWH